MARPHGKGSVPKYIMRQLEKQITRLEKTQKDREMHLAKLKLLRHQLAKGDIEAINADDNPVE